MRRKLSVSTLLLGASIAGAALALSQELPLRPLPSAARGVLLSEMFGATRTEQADLQRAGYTLREIDGELKTGDRRERLYTFEGSAGSSATLVDREYPAYFLDKRKLVFEMTFSAKQGGSGADLAGVTPQLITTAEKSVRDDPAILAGLGYLATAAGIAVKPETLRSAVIEYLQAYRQPSAPPQEACPGCGSQSGFGDQYYGGPDTDRALNVREAGWTIAGFRHYWNGKSAFILEVTAKIPRR